jgi:hypothetical protein
VLLGVKVLNVEVFVVVPPAAPAACTDILYLVLGARALLLVQVSLSADIVPGTVLPLLVVTLTVEIVPWATLILTFLSSRTFEEPLAGENAISAGAAVVVTGAEPLSPPFAPPLTSDAEDPDPDWHPARTVVPATTATRTALSDPRRRLRFTRFTPSSN